MIPVRATHVFLNCPFDLNYLPVFRALVFAVFDLGFFPRCSLEVDDSSESRLDKIMRMIEECRYGIHDLSAVQLDRVNRLPRFNMPLELGLFLGCKRFGERRQHQKGCLVLDRIPYRYRASMSDISGQDIHVHGGKPEKAIVEVRNWLATASRHRNLPGGADVVDRYRRFSKQLPALSRELRLKPDGLIYSDFCNIIRIWLKADR